MRAVMTSCPFRVGVLVVSGIAQYATAYILLPRTADGVAVTVLKCATVQRDPVDGCPGTTIFHRTFTDTATVSGVRATLDQLHYEVRSIFDHRDSNYWWQTHVYRITLLWHGIAVKSYVAPYFHIWFDATTLGGVQQWAPDGPTTWQDLVRLTGMPLAPNGEPLPARLVGWAPHSGVQLQMVVVVRRRITWGRGRVRAGQGRTNENHKTRIGISRSLAGSPNRPTGGPGRQPLPAATWA